ncbi:AraC family transcriptional regulator [Derxia lacustris]|uniref:AraC family transcriptional regulator n=1 Tax=Derxia lacustris TaxID=764842 RepID=UPI000A17533E|nr:helix-turn-helix domain-containing protein [Derxia lacustris]
MSAVIAHGKRMSGYMAGERHQKHRGNAGVIASAHETLHQVETELLAETHGDGLVERLCATRQVFAANGLHAEAQLAASWLPQALLAEGRVGEALVQASRLLVTTALPVTLRLHGGHLAIQDAAFDAATVKSPSAAELLRRVALLCADGAATEAALHARLACCLGEYQAYLVEVGRPCTRAVSPRNPTPAPLDAIRPFFARLAAELEAHWRDCGSPRPSGPRFHLVRALFRGVADPHHATGDAFNMIRASYPGLAVARSHLLEARWHDLSERPARAREHYHRALNAAEATRQQPLCFAAHFHLSHVYRQLGDAQRALLHKAAYCEIQRPWMEALRRQVQADALWPAAAEPPDMPLLPADGPARAEPAYLQRACRHLEADLSAPLDSAALIQAAGVGRRTLETAFRRFRNTTPGRYLRELRLARANELLVTTDLPLRLIREQVGYASASAFSVDYRQRYGVAPSTSRKT